jgi:hypothetical protein
MTLLSGLLKCGICGSGFSKISQSHYGRWWQSTNMRRFFLASNRSSRKFTGLGHRAPEFGPRAALGSLRPFACPFNRYTSIYVPHFASCRSRGRNHKGPWVHPRGRRQTRTRFVPFRRSLGVSVSNNCKRPLAAHWRLPARPLAKRPLPQMAPLSSRRARLIFLWNTR